MKTMKPHAKVLEDEAGNSIHTSIKCDVKDGEFPFCSGTSNGVKCCTKCGATKTPQWREGPYGPKTLCNACGVKRTRKLRADQEGTKRRRASLAPTKATKSATAVTTKAAAVHLKKEETGPDEIPIQLQCQGSMTMPPDTCGSTVKRPTRKAAEEAAVRTARYARTGEWLNLSSPQNINKSPKSMFKFDISNHQTTPSSSSDGVSLPMSDCPEEIAWTPQVAKSLAGGCSRSPDYTVRSPDDCFAAINLMTMSADCAMENHLCFQERTLSLQSPPRRSMGVHPSNSDVLAALRKASCVSGGIFTDKDIALISNSVPPAKVDELLKLSHELESALQGCSAAEASLSVIAAALASKQALLLQNRCKVDTASIKLRQFVHDLDTQFGLTHKELPKIRVTPLKKTKSI